MPQPAASPSSQHQNQVDPPEVETEPGLVCSDLAGRSSSCVLCIGSCGPAEEQLTSSNSNINKGAESSVQPAHRKWRPVSSDNGEDGRSMNEKDNRRCFHVLLKRKQVHSSVLLPCSSQNGRHSQECLFCEWLTRLFEDRSKPPICRCTLLFLNAACGKSPLRQCSLISQARLWLTEGGSEALLGPGAVQRHYIFTQAFNAILIAP